MCILCNNHAMLPMISLRKPSTQSITKFLASQSALDLTYAAVGATRSQPPSGYNVDHTRIKLGEGRQVFLDAKAALQERAHFRLDWVEARSIEPSIRVGGMFAVFAKAIGLWWTNACRIIYLIDQKSPVEQYGIAHGTLPAHMESGEERFLIEWDPADNCVWYDILAFSRPHGLIARLGSWRLRAMQKRFAKESAATMLRAVSK